MTNIMPEETIILSDPQMEKRFWDKVKIPDDVNDHWLWTAYKDKNAVGRFCIGADSKGASVIRRAPRIVMVLELGKAIPDGMLVIHLCGNETCVNPAHLRIDNYDGIAKNRMQMGWFLKYRNE